MTLIDAGPLIALINRNDPNHVVCAAALVDLPSGPLLTTWPTFTEAMYLLHRVGGHAAQQQLWRLIADGRLVLLNLSVSDGLRAAELMQTYRDLPMDLADATLVAAAESAGRRQIFTLDSDFHIYRLNDGSVMRVVP